MITGGLYIGAQAIRITFNSLSLRFATGHCISLMSSRPRYGRYMRLAPW